MVCPKVVVLTTAYNCEKWLDRCLVSIQNQSYKNFECHILDDMSTDDTGSIATLFCKDDSRFIYHLNGKKYYQAGNYDQILRSDLIDDEAVVVEVDGDDWLSSYTAIQKVVDEHNKGFLVTQGSFTYSDGRPGFAKPFKVSELRVTNANATHLRSWRAKLWKAIAIEDLKVDGWYADNAGDVFFMLPMLEMAGDDRIKFISECLYVYNEDNPLNEHKVNLGNQWKLAKLGRSYPKYEVLPKDTV